MTPKEKAINLVDRFMLRIILNIKSDINFSVMESAKECALLSVEEILETDPMIEGQISDAGVFYKDNSDYWEQVKEEINKL